jgi:hypothetical protein
MMTVGRLRRVTSLFNELATWFVLASGAFCFALSLIGLTIGRAKPEMTELGARSQAWRDLRFSLIIVALGVFLFEDGWKHERARWLLCILYPRSRSGISARSADQASGVTRVSQRLSSPEG